jgi:hypothetical protein
MIEYKDYINYHTHRTSHGSVGNSLCWTCNKSIPRKDKVVSIRTAYNNLTYYWLDFCEKCFLHIAGDRYVVKQKEYDPDDVPF